MVPRNYSSFADADSIGSGTSDKDVRADSNKHSTGFFSLFRFATSLDIVLMIVGSLFTCVNGLAWPVTTVFFGDMTNLFAASSNLTEEKNLSWNSSGSAVILPSPTNAMTHKMNDVILRFVYIGCLVLVASFMQVACWTIACERQIFKMRKKFLHSVLHQEMSWFSRQKSGSLTSRLTSDIDRVKDGLGDKMSFAIFGFAQFIGGFAVGFYKAWDLTLVMVAFVPLLVIAGAVNAKVISWAATKEQEMYARAGAIAEEVISCIRTVTAFGGQKREVKRYDRELEAGEKLGIRMAFATGIGTGFIFMVLYATYALAFWYGSTLILKGKRQVGEIFTVIFSVVAGAFSIGIASPQFSVIATAKGAAAALFEVIDNVPYIDAYTEYGLKPSKVGGNIEFRDVRFRYPTRPDVQVVTDVQIFAKPNQTIALVGNSGCGKSTLLSLLQRFYDPEDGQVLLDGCDLRTLNVHWLRSKIGVVGQMPVLFGFTISENIALGRDLKPKNIERAARAANIHNFIMTLRKGYQTKVGERGSQLSGGQRQRIAIARALVTNPTILLLDEATSALDTESERLVQASLDKAREGRTTIIVAHRLSTIQNADVIYVMDRGQVVEQGTHEALLNQRGIYYELVSLQRLGKTDGDRAAQPESIDGKSDAEIDTAAWNIAYEMAANQATNTVEEPTKETPGETPSFLTILKQNAPEAKWIVAGSVGSVILGCSMPAFSLLYSQMFEEFQQEGDDLRESAVFWSCMFLVLGVGTALGHILQSSMFGTSGDKLTHRLRLQTFQNILRQDMAYFDEADHTTGSLTTRLATDAPLLKSATGMRLGIMANSLVAATCAVATAMIFGWKLGLVIIGATPILVLAGVVSMKFQSGGEKKNTEHAEKSGQIASEAIGNLQTVQSLSQERFFYETFSKYIRLAHHFDLRRSAIYAVSYGFSQAVIFFLYAGSFRFGYYLVSNGEMSFADVFRVFFGIIYVAMTFGQVIAFLPDYSKAKTSAGQIFSMIGQVPVIDSSDPNGVKLNIKGEIEFRNVSFAYPSRPDVPILQKLSFHIQPGQTLAIVGASGCGKSTMVSLLERFYNPTEGQILVDGVDIRCMNLQHFRSQLAVVEQEPVLFNTTARENILYALPEDWVGLFDEELYGAAKTANIHEFVLGLPEQYDTIVGEKGVQLSGGERQRVAIARAVIRNPRILLLDEATSALDSNSEKSVQVALESARAGRTCITIAHRLSTVRNADVIVLMDKGQIIEQGSHEELVAKNGHYAQLTRGQKFPS